MLYTASDIIKRSMQLADITNTDFLTHEEQTAYLNDAWTTVFQWLINKGDKQFVQEVELQNPQGFNEWVEYDIPSDLYQICSLKNKISGQIVNRQAESQGINSGNYEIVNDKIRLYGVRTGPLLLTYWVKPIDITFPDKDIYTDLPFVYNPNGYILSRCGNTVLTRDGIIYNTLTNETLGNIEDIDNTHSYLLGKGFYIDNSNIYNLKGESIGTIGAFPSNYFYDNDDNLWYEISPGTYQSGIGRPVKTLEFTPLSKYKDFYLVGNKIYKDDVEVYDLTGYVSSLSQGMNIYTTNKGFYIALDTHALIVYLEDDIDVSVVDNETNIITKYGNLTTDFENFIVKSNIEDTIFDFPNEIYYSLLCTDLALRYCMKQNANTDGLNNLYENYRTTYMNTLSQDSGYERITNVYGR